MPVGKFLQQGPLRTYSAARHIAVSPGWPAAETFITGGAPPRTLIIKGIHVMNIKSILVSLILSLVLALPAFAAGPVDINSADAKTIAEALTGIGLSKAEAIVAYRAENGPFASADDLSKVKGVGEKTVERNRDLIVTGSSKSKTAASKAPKAPAAG